MTHSNQIKNGMKRYGTVQNARFTLEIVDPSEGWSRATELSVSSKGDAQNKVHEILRQRGSKNFSFGLQVTRDDGKSKSFIWSRHTFIGTSDNRNLNDWLDEGKNRG